jgi:hypothetical protein
MSILRFPRYAALPLCLGALVAVSANGQTSAVRTSASRTTVTVGDTLTYRVEVIAPDSASVNFGAPLSRLGEFETSRHVSMPKRELVGGMSLWREEYVLAVYSPGRHPIPPIPAAVTDQGGVTQTLLGDTVRVDVRSVLGESEETLRDIKGLATKPARRVWPWVIPLAAAVGVVLGLWLWRRRRRTPALARSEPPVAPEVEALRRLDGLLGAGFLENGRFKEFYTELSDIARDYVCGRHSLAAQEMTTAELAEAMERLGLTHAFRSEMCLVLGESDMVKFAKFTPGIDMAYGTAQKVRDVIEMSTLREAQPEAVAS